MTDAPGEQAQPPEAAETSGVGLTYSRTAQGEWTPELARHELKVATTTHRQQQESEQARHDREEVRKDNAQRRHQQRVMFWVVVGVTVGMLTVALISVFAVDNEQTKEWARSIVTLIVGGIIGGVAGYLSGHSSK